MKKIIIIAVNILLIMGWIIYTNIDESNTDISITAELGIDEITISAVQDAFDCVPSNVIRDFTDKNWKIVIIKNDDNNDTVGKTDFTNQTITIYAHDIFTGSIKSITLHEICHYIDRMYGDLSKTANYENIFKNNQDYINYSYSGITETEQNKNDMHYATESAQELFAEGLRDFYMYPEWMKMNHYDMYKFYKKNIN